MSLNSLGASNGHTSSRMTHSLSTPSGVDGSTSASHQSRGGKKLAVRVQMLDDSMTMFQVQVGTKKDFSSLPHLFLPFDFFTYCIRRTKIKMQWKTTIGRWTADFFRQESFSFNDETGSSGQLSGNWFNLRNKQWNILIRSAGLIDEAFDDFVTL